MDYLGDRTPPGVPPELEKRFLSTLKFPEVSIEPVTEDVDQNTNPSTPLDALKSSPGPTPLPKGHLVVSPYTTPPHLLELASVSRANQLLAEALSLLQPVRNDYATAPYKDAFNWPAIIYRLRHLLKKEVGFPWAEAQKFYVIVFRSCLPPMTDRVHLGAIDQLAHAEATASGGLLKYWFGVPDAEGRNLATCIWREFADAKQGNRGPGHRQAMMETRTSYLEWSVERLALVVGADAGTWDVVDWH